MKLTVNDIGGLLRKRHIFQVDEGKCRQICSIKVDVSGSINLVVRDHYTGVTRLVPIREIGDTISGTTSYFSTKKYKPDTESVIVGVLEKDSTSVMALPEGADYTEWNTVVTMKSKDISFEHPSSWIERMLGRKPKCL